jgi:hypothetical protein
MRSHLPKGRSQPARGLWLEREAKSESEQRQGPVLVDETS